MPESGIILYKLLSQYSLIYSTIHLEGNINKHKAKAAQASPLT